MLLSEQRVESGRVVVAGAVAPAPLEAGVVDCPFKLGSKRLLTWLGKEISTQGWKDVTLWVSESALCKVSPEKWPPLLMGSCVVALAVPSLQSADFSQLPNCWNLTAQYCRPQLNALEYWEQMGGKAFHPGDYDGDELLEALQEMQGHWLYWGHGEPDRLRGYGHLMLNEILAHKPAMPLGLTAWLTCNTLGSAPGGSLGLNWYLAGGTQAFLGAICPVDTEANQRLSARFLQALESTGPMRLSNVVRHMFSTMGALGQRGVHEEADHYRLLGNPGLTVFSPTV